VSRIIELKGLTPLVLRRADIKGESVSICRCGLSATFPFCDSSHKAARGEEADRLYQYVREVPSGKLVRLDMAKPPGSPAPDEQPAVNEPVAERPEPTTYI
jgi:CDGSH iron-sulfur domain-containing protein 1